MCENRSVVSLKFAPTRIPWSYLRQIQQFGTAQGVNIAQTDLKCVIFSLNVTVVLINF